MTITCPQQNVRDVRITPKPTSAMDVLLSAPTLEVLYGPGFVDPFDCYYRTGRENCEAPHYAFANLSTAEELAPFFRKFGCPSYEGRRLLLNEVLVEAKRLNLLMKMRSAWSHSLDKARELIAQFDFANHYNARWFYWPAPLVIDNEASQRSIRFHLDLLEQQRQQAVNRAAGYKNKDELQKAIVSAICGVSEALRWVEFVPDVLPEPRGKTFRLSWSLRPVQFLGEEHTGEYEVTHEEPHIAVPYLLMFLLDLCSDQQMRVCADSSCRRVFGARRGNQRYCEPGCAHRSAVREYRRRRKHIHERSRANGSTKIPRKIGDRAYTEGDGARAVSEPLIHGDHWLRLDVAVQEWWTKKTRRTAGHEVDFP